MKIKKIFFQILIFTCLLFSVNQVISVKKVEVYFFWGSGCPHCAKAKSFFEKLKEKYPQLEVKEFEVYFNENNQKLFQEIAKAYNTEPIGVPTIFIGKEFLLGFSSEETTGKEIENLIQNCLQNYCPSPGEILASGGIDKWQPPEEVSQKPEFETSTSAIEKSRTQTSTSSFSTLKVEKTQTYTPTSSSSTSKEEISVPLFGKEIKIPSQSSLIFLGTILGLADGINPCMFSVLLFLLTYLLAIGSKKKAIKAGLIFTVGVFVVYFLFMLGIIKVITLIGFISKIKIVVTLFAFIFGLIMIKDFFAYGKGISLEIPESAKPLIEKLIKKGTIPSAILLALLSSLVELPCTAGIPLVYTTLLAEKAKVHIPYLLWYNIFFVLPLLLIIAIVSFAFAEVNKIEKWRLSFRKYMRLLSGLILLFLAVALFKGWM